ncbi:MAG: choice-of-anchor L domain-containing protein [Desulfobacterales bacterium]|nr:choice-of-anchor L domain-containing protein [Desulfobacterales bacterium]
MKKVILFLAIFSVLAFSAPSSAMTITAFDSAGNLAQSLAGTGIAISNVSYNGASAASGYFAGGTAAGIGIDKGIVLTTGLASNLHGASNTSDSITGSHNTAGDADLSKLISNKTTYDAAVLEFDFKISETATAAYFNYVFGSEEYNEWAKSTYNDVFGFFVNEVNSVNKVNYALIPGTSTPVSISSVNKWTNQGFFNNNDLTDYPSPILPYPFEYDGFTDVFTASLTDLDPQKTYHIKLAIADVGDSTLDSGVFLQAASFSNSSVSSVSSVPEPAITVLLASSLLGLAGFRFRMKYRTK